MNRPKEQLKQYILLFLLIFISTLYVQEKTSTKFQTSATTYLDLEKQLCTDSFTATMWKLYPVPCPTEGIVTVNQGGRLGNQIWEYASAWVVSKESGLEAFIPRCIHNRLTQLFKDLPHKSMEEISHCPVNMNNFAQNLDKWKGRSQGIRLRESSTEPKLVSKWAKLISDEFPLRDDLVSETDKILWEARRNTSNNLFIGVHVRRTDYSKYITSRYKGDVPTKDYFFKAMDYYERKFKNVTFIVTSDDRKWCLSNLGKRKNVFIPPPGSAYLDLALMSRCNHSIYDYGTYGAWGAIYAGGETIYYNVSKYHMTKDMNEILPSWHTL